MGRMGFVMLVGAVLAGVLVLGGLAILWVMARVWQSSEEDDSPWFLDEELSSNGADAIDVDNNAIDQPGESQKDLPRQPGQKV